VGAGPFITSVLVVAGKDLRIELRTREIVTTAGFFAVLVALMASVAYTGAPGGDTRVAPGTIWLSIAFSSVMAIGRSWQREREDACFTALLVSPAPRAALFAGKALGVLAFVLAVEAVVVPVVALVFHIELLPLLGPLAVVLLTGTLGIASAGTLFGAMTVRTRARDLVLATVLFPLLSPTMISSVAATRDLVGGGTLDDVSGWLVLLATFDVLAFIGGMGLFGALVDE
jgi:heme exporter protein B